MKTIMFPGQGSQYKGMGKDLFKIYEKETSLASNILGYDIEELCVKNPNKELDKTQFTQPALYVVNAFSYYELQKKGTPDYLIGHSLGEYNALLAAGAFTFETGLKLVQKRGELMSKASGGAMAAVLGIEINELKQKLKGGGYHDIDIANFNTFTQTVIAGKKESIVKVLKDFEKQEIRIIPLNVSAPFHSRYMKPAAAEFVKFIKKFEFSSLDIPVISNVTALPYSDKDIAKLLGKQIMGSVRWTESLLWLMKNGVTDFQEIGGKILTKMVGEVKLKSEISQTKKELSLESTILSQPQKKILSEEEKSYSMQLGSEAFKNDYGVDYTYLAGSMHRGIASKELVVKMAKSNMLGFLGTKEMPIREVEESLRWIKQKLIKKEPFGSNLFYSLDTRLEKELVELYLKHEVYNVETTGFETITPALVQYKLQGLRQNENGETILENKIIAKVSRPEVAELFMNPAPENIVTKLLESGLVTKEQAILSKRVPMSYDICAESDSGWNTNRKMSNVLLPSIQELRTRIQNKRNYEKQIRIGLAGGIGTPQAVASAYVMEADFILTGSINQCSVEAGTSEIAKDLLQKINVQDTDYVPATDLFEFGGQAQVLRKGVMFSTRANKLYDLYKKYNSLDEIPERIIRNLEKNYFKRSLDDVWNEIVLNNGNVEDAETLNDTKNSKVKMASVFRWYFDQSTLFAMKGDQANYENFQIYTGSSLGAFNQWVKNTSLEDWRNRHVDKIGIEMMNAAVPLLKKGYV